jgi:hypothetical protein
VGDGHRHIVLHLRQLAGRLFQELDEVRPDITGRDIVYEFLARFEHHQERMRELAEHPLFKGAQSDGNS